MSTGELRGFTVSRVKRPRFKCTRSVDRERVQGCGWRVPVAVRAVCRSELDTRSQEQSLARTLPRPSLLVRSTLRIVLP